MTGLANDLINGIISVANGKLIIALLLTMLCCIVLGMGVPTTANYCIMAATCAPILVRMGVPTLAAHFLCILLWYCCRYHTAGSAGCYAGSAIAKANPMKTAFTASKLAIAVFIVPYVFCFNPANAADRLPHRLRCSDLYHLTVLVIWIVLLTGRLPVSENVCTGSCLNGSRRTDADRSVTDD